MTPAVPTPPDPLPSAPVVAEVLRRLDGLQDRPVSEHVEVFDDVHRRLQDALATLDEV